ncbi:sterol desaturase family protein [Foetidibacter luteolus]|uniref:sterol desaturase family protein n=1 Tax=Foetidibacter luteolus TaxID=2608880 RepID=UPI00129AF95B|nr:sterol desaturase family protein [Foetidibacter luteolus]
MKKNYVSNSTESTRMFRSSFMESLSKVHFSVPLFIYIPAIAVFIYLAFANGISAGFFALYFLGGLAVWTITEYLLHRYIFHYVPKSKWGLRLHFIFHGVHHDYPKDAKRLVMPPSASIPLALLFYFLFLWILQNKTNLYAFFPGFLVGYLIYDMMHYAMHHYNFKSSLMKKVKQHHMLHHYDDSTKGYGVSTALWDVIFRSGFPKKQKNEEKR